MTFWVLMFVELLVVLALLMFADRWLHRHLQGLMYLLTNDEEIALWLYALILFPGVLLHELSHAFIAALLGVKIGRINIFPRRIGNRIQLGFVPVEETDFIRASLIGAAPLFFGSLAIYGIGAGIFGTPVVIEALSRSDWWQALQGLRMVFQAPDMWFWAYLVFAVGNTMLPSRSDIHAWPLLGIVTLFLAGVVLLAGGGAFLLNGFSQLLTWAFRWLIFLGGSTLLIDIPFFAVLFLLERIIGRIKGQYIVYR